MKHRQIHPISSLWLLSTMVCSEECGENYDRVEDLCIRISPYKLNWDDAQAKCESEGGHLVSLTSEAQQIALNKLIKNKENSKKIFEAGSWTTEEIEGYWTGGMVMRE